MHIRTAKQQDIQAISALAVTTFIENFGHLYPVKDLDYHLEKTCSPEYFQKALEKDTILIAENDLEMVGYLKFGKVGLPLETIQDNDIELHRIYISTPYQGKSIGKLLMEALLSKPEAQAAPTIYLGVWEKNMRAQGFYQHYGFEIIGEYDYYVGEHVDREWIMAKRNSSQTVNTSLFGNSSQ